VEISVLLTAPSGFIPCVADLDEAAGTLAPRLIAYVLARTGCRRTAEDIAQDALTALVRRWRHVGPPESPDAYVFAIAKRRVGRAIIRRALTVPLEVLRGVAGDEPAVDRSYEQRAELATVMTALRALPRADREALLLRLVGELPFTEIAVLMHTSPAAVKMRVSRARRRLVNSLPERSNGRRTHTA
jgi:RNA polymerase sigma-70 factor (ECF subfamily)